jgi:hypothetical protein
VPSWLLPSVVLACASAAWLLAPAGEPGRVLDADQPPTEIAQAGEGPTLWGVPRDRTGATRCRATSRELTQVPASTAPLETATTPEAATNAKSTDTYQRLPPDPIERGTCSLEVQLTGEGDELPKHVSLQLWRIAAPASEHYGVGDQRVATGDERNGRVEWHELAEGTYRIFCPEARRGSEDAPAFAVRGASTRMTLAIAGTREVPVFVRLVDEYGAPLVEGKRRSGGTMKSGLDAQPPWHVQRPLLRGGFWGRGGATSFGSCHASDRPVVASPDGFALDTQREAARATRWADRWTLTFAARTSVEVSARSDDACFPGPLRYVAVSLPLDPIAASVRMADGRLATQAGAKLSAVCEAMVVPHDGSWLDPRSLPIEVQVTLQGYAPLEFTTTLDEPTTERVLVKAAPKE